MPLDSPVYLDANILVGATITRHRLYKAVARLIGELLTREATILVSILTIQESLWALARLSFCDLYRQPSSANFNLRIYKRRCAEIFEKYGDRMGAISSMLADWSRAGIAVGVVPNTDPDFLRACELTPRYMRQYRMAPADAAHLAVAELYARTFITADSDFEEPASVEPFDNLAVVHLKA